MIVSHVLQDWAYYLVPVPTHVEMESGSNLVIIHARNVMLLAQLVPDQPQLAPLVQAENT